MQLSQGKDTVCIGVWVTLFAGARVFGGRWGGVRGGPKCLRARTRCSVTDIVDTADQLAAMGTGLLDILIVHIWL